MKTRVRRWGNSLGLRIPKSFAEQVSVEDGSAVDLSVSGSDLIIRPLEPRYELADLLSGVEPGNVHSELLAGEPVGRESW